jgi:hypothetical protein
MPDERILHLVEGGRHARLLQALMNETQQLELFPGQHRYLFPQLAGGPLTQVWAQGLTENKS